MEVAVQFSGIEKQQVQPQQHCPEETSKAKSV
jgi:hypothetical protein